MTECAACSHALKRRRELLRELDDIETLFRLHQQFLPAIEQESREGEPGRAPEPVATPDAAQTAATTPVRTAPHGGSTTLPGSVGDEIPRTIDLGEGIPAILRRGPDNSLPAKHQEA
jgi:hypothetical protein